MTRASFAARLSRRLQSPPFWRAVLALLVLVVAYLALSPNPPHDVDTGWDKLNHAFAFSSLALSASFAGTATRRHVAAAALLLLAFGGAIELIQAQVGRDAEWADLLADAVGIGAGLLLAWAVRRWMFRPTAADR